MLATGPSRKGGGQWQGRDPYNRVVNFLAPPGGIRAGEEVPLRVVEATPHSLIGQIPDAGLKDPLHRAEEGTLA